MEENSNSCVQLADTWHENNSFYDILYTCSNIMD